MMAQIIFDEKADDVQRLQTLLGSYRKKNNLAAYLFNFLLSSFFVDAWKQKVQS